MTTEKTTKGAYLQRRGEAAINTYFPTEFVDKVWEHIHKLNKASSGLHKITMREFVYMVLNAEISKKPNTEEAK